MVDYYNPESNLYRYLKELIEAGDFDNIKTLENLTPSCPYSKYGPLDVINTAIKYRKCFMILYFIEERGLKSDLALLKSLECNQIDTAIYLYGKGFKLLSRNHIYSLEVMKLVVSWGYGFDDYAFKYITQMWNGKDVVERVKYLFELNNLHISKMDYYTEYNLHEDVACFMIDHTDKELFPEIMLNAVKSDWFIIVNKLRLLGVNFDIKHLEIIASSNEYEEVEKLRKELNIPITDLYSFIFLDTYTFTDNIKHYLKNMTNICNFAITYDLMTKACVFCDQESVHYLLDNDVIITNDHIEIIFDMEANNYADRGYDWHITKSIVSRCGPEIKDKIQYILEQIGED